MARGNRLGVKGNSRRRIQQREHDSEESDEEYKVAEDEDCDESDENYSFDGDESEELLDDFKRVARSRNTRSRKGSEIMKPRKRRRFLYTDNDDDDDKEEYEIDEEEDAEFVSLGRKVNPEKKPRVKKRVSYTEVDDYEDDDAECMSSGRKRNQRMKPQKNRISYTEDDDDDAEFMSSNRKRNQRTKYQEKNSVSYTEEEDDNNDDAEFMSLGRKRNQRTKPQEKNRVSYTEDDDDDAEFMSSGRKRNQRTKPQEKNRVSYTEEDDDDAEFMSSGRKINERTKPQEKNRVSYSDDNVDEDAEFMSSGKIRKLQQQKKLREKRKVSYTEDDDEDGSEFMSSSSKGHQIKEPQEKTMVSYTEDHQEEEEDKNDAEFMLSESDFVNDEDDSPKTTKEEEDENDAEFILSESDFFDDEDDSPKTKKKDKVSRYHPQKKKSVRGGLKKSKTSKTEKPKQRNHSFGRKSNSSKKMPVRNKNHLAKRRNKISKRQKRRVTAESDPDFASSASSDREYTISEEEREQMREARVYCANLRATLRSSSCVKQEQEPFCEQRKYPVRKGKEKVEDMKDEIGKQVCGICLSEEGKRTVRGVLSCCRHYFCFSCIMEWSKVESRCPLCKQRFATITKAAKSDTGFDLRTVVIPVPECDQVYEPSEEELRGYLDPYESVTCTECHHGGDDELMLLCDICDSPAHTFCVGLGREVPVDNWYCEGCRPTIFASLNPTSDRRLSSDLSSPIAGGFDLNELYVPETPLTQQTHVLPEPRPSVREFTPAISGTIATTLRDRRRIHRQIHHRFLNNNRMSDLVGRSSGTSASSSSGIRLFGSQLDEARDAMITPHASFNRNEEYIMPSLHDTNLFSPRPDQYGVQVQNSTFGSVDVSLQGEHGGFDSRLGYAQLHPCTNRSSIGSDACREVIGSSRTSQDGLHAP